MVYKGKVTQTRGHHEKMLECAVKVSGFEENKGKYFPSIFCKISLILTFHRIQICLDDQCDKEPARTTARETLTREGKILLDLIKCPRITRVRIFFIY